MSASYIENFGYLPELGYRFFPERLALIQGATQLTFSDLEARANRVANALRASGVGKGERVALMQGNDLRFVESLLGTMRAGAVAVPVNVRSGNDAMRHVLRDSGSRLIIASAEWADLARRLAADAPDVRLVIAAGDPSAGAIAYDAWLASASDGRPLPCTTPADLCLMPYTSGSTGRPKGVELDHAGQIHNADIKRRVYMLKPEERTLISGPLYHANALTGSLYPFLLAGCSAVILPQFDPVAVIEAIERFRCTHTVAVPTMYALILRQRDALGRHDLSSVRFLGSGSAPVTLELLTELQAAFGGAPIVEGYGMTESGPIVTVLPRWGKTKLGSCGLLAPDVEARLVREDGTPTRGPDDVGEIWVRSPGVTRGYHNLPEVTAERITPDGWLKTGDLMRRDDEGFYYFLGRRDDQISVGGENVYPREVESIVLQHGGVSQVCVVAVPHPLKGHVPVAFVVRREGEQPGEEELKSFYLERGAAYSHPRRHFFVDELPLAGTGKVDRKLLEQRAREAMREPAAVE